MPPLVPYFEDLVQSATFKGTSNNDYLYNTEHMSQAIAELAPQLLWKNFAALNAVPRPSKKEERVIAFMRQFGETLQLPVEVDAVGNVLIRKPATAGMEDRPTIILQSHLDMVHQKNADTNFDFDTQGIQMHYQEDWVTAEGTTLGADNGIGVAAIMALLESTDIAHPPLEALFTIDEETGMTGAKGLQPGWLQGQLLLNLDTEEDDELTVGAAGGIDVTAEGTYAPEPVGAGYQYHTLTLKGLAGGHSGMDIHLGRANANKQLARVLHHVLPVVEGRLVHFDGGSLRNAIPREAVATIAIPEAQAAALTEELTAWGVILQQEYRQTDPHLSFSYEGVAPSATEAPSAADQKAFLAALAACPDGIYRMSSDMEDLVQTSNNLARVVLGDGSYQALCLTRSAVDSEKGAQVDAVKAVFELIGATVTTSGDYPGWTPNLEAPIIGMMQDIYQSLFGTAIHVYAGHGGLECGIFRSSYPDLDMISFGPNIRGAHSPDERVQVSSVQKFWRFLLATLERIPAKG